MEANQETIMVTGGVAGHVAMTEDLHIAAQGIDYAAALLSEATVCTVATENQIDSLPVGLVPDQEWQRTKAYCAVANVMAGPSGTRRAEDALLDIGVRLRFTVAALEEAENAAFSTMSFVARGKAALEDVSDLHWYPARAFTWALWSAMPLGIAMEHGPGDPVDDLLHPGVPNTTGLANRDVLDLLGTQVPDAAYRATAILVAAQLAVAELMWKEPQYLMMSRREGLFADRKAPGSIADLITTVQDVEEPKDGSVAIQCIPDEDGDRYIVSIPGTQDWLLHDPNVNDAQGDTAAMAGMMTPAMQAVVDAMLLAGIPADAEVMLVGHSQGGINAMALASSQQFLQRYNVTHVVTTGAPVARFVTPPHIQSLHIEHAEDIVPGTDLMPNPDRPNQTTVTHAISQSPNVELATMGRTIGGAHHLDGYIATAELAESGISTSVDAFKASASEFLSGGADVTTTVYTQEVIPLNHVQFVANR